jgi:hypothetical protein
MLAYLFRILSVYQLIAAILTNGLNSPHFRRRERTAAIMHPIPNIPASLSREIYVELCTLLPPPPDNTPEARAQRDERAMTAVAHLLPENAAEAEVAVLIVAAQFRAREALRAASRPNLDPDQTRRLTAQAASMMRQADSFIRTLLRMQAERQKAEDAARPAAMQRAGYWFRSVSAPEPDPTPRPAEPAPSPAELPKLEYGVMTPAERFVTLYPDRAATILAAGGLPARLTFPPPDAAVIEELLASTSPLVEAFRHAHRPEPVAA